MWTLDQDDYTGMFCRQGPFPLTRKIHELLQTSDHSKEREVSSSTKSHTKLTTSITSTIQRRMSTSRKPTQTSAIPSKSKNFGVHTQNNRSLYLLIFILFLL